MMGLCRGLVHQAIMDAARPLLRETYLDWWRTHDTFGVVPTRSMVTTCLGAYETKNYFPVSFRYFELLDACPLRMPPSPVTQPTEPT